MSQADVDEQVARREIHGTVNLVTATAGLYDDRGNYDASVNTFPAAGGSGQSGAILKGDVWTISVAGTLGTVPVFPDDTVRAKSDAPGQTAGNWSINKAGQKKAVTTSAASVSPTAADSGTYYRLTNANPTFNLPTTGRIVGETEYFVTFAGSNAFTGSVNAGVGSTVDFGTLDPSAPDWPGFALQAVSGLPPFRMFHIRYVAANVWASNLFNVAV